jgi:hypothetical protein
VRSLAWSQVVEGLVSNGRPNEATEELGVSRSLVYRLIADPSLILLGEKTFSPSSLRRRRISPSSFS